jgi:hypothetical protein
MPFKMLHLEDIDWLIIGACTGSSLDMTYTKYRLENPSEYRTLEIMPYGKKWTLQPRIKWVREIVEAADKAGIPVFLKDNLNPLFKGSPTEDIVAMGFAMKHKTNLSAWQLRQEMPSIPSE